MLGVLSKGESLDPPDAQDGLTALNALMGTLTNTPMVFAPTLDTIPLSAGVSSITVGPSGTTITGRPLKVLDESYIDNGTTTYPLRVYTDQQYSDILVKTTTGTPEGVWPLMNMPDVQLTFWPVPIGGLTLKLWSIKALSTFPGLTTAVRLPEGYEDLLALELAEALAPEYQVDVPAPVMDRLKRARRNIQTTNLRVPMLQIRPELQCRPFNVLTNQ